MCVSVCVYVSVCVRVGARACVRACSYIDVCIYMWICICVRLYSIELLFCGFHKQKLHPHHVQNHQQLNLNSAHKHALNQ